MQLLFEGQRDCCLGINTTVVHGSVGEDQHNCCLRVNVTVVWGLTQLLFGDLLVRIKKLFLCPQQLILSVDKY